MKPLALTIGDAAGVGPELLLSAAHGRCTDAPVVVYGSLRVLEAARRSLVEVVPRGSLVERLVAVERPADAVSVGPGALAVIDIPTPALDDDPRALDPYPWGVPRAAFGQLQYDALCRAIDDALSNEVEALVTAPWHKARLADAGLPPTGHTEVLQERSGVERVVMLLAGDVLRVALATVHIPVSEVAGRLSVDELVEIGALVARGLTLDYGIAAPRIAFCGLNPHAGESSTIGDEDERIVAPAVAVLVARGIDAVGPLPADTLFPRVTRGLMRADAVVAMYHDQGLGPLKTFHFGEAANITLGLPYVRTSVDHGTAYDIAGRGLVDASSFAYATRLARAMAARRELVRRSAPS